MPDLPSEAGLVLEMIANCLIKSLQGPAWVTVNLWLADEFENRVYGPTAYDGALISGPSLLLV